jgi:hypothetical protein
MTVPPSLLDPLAEQNAVMGGLEKFTDYNITVLSFTDPGDGIRSQPVEVRTNEDGKFSLYRMYHLNCNPYRNLHRNEIKVSLPWLGLP